MNTVMKLPVPTKHAMGSSAKKLFVGDLDGIEDIFCLSHYCRRLPSFISHMLYTEITLLLQLSTERWVQFENYRQNLAFKHILQICISAGQNYMERDTK
jgi:hypothetical protein